MYFHLQLRTSTSLHRWPICLFYFSSIHLTFFYSAAERIVVAPIFNRNWEYGHFLRLRGRYAYFIRSEATGCLAQAAFLLDRFRFLCCLFLLRIFACCHLTLLGSCRSSTFVAMKAGRNQIPCVLGAFAWAQSDLAGMKLALITCSSLCYCAGHISWRLRCVCFSSSANGFNSLTFLGDFHFYRLLSSNLGSQD